MKKYKLTFQSMNGEVFEEIGSYESKLEAIYSIQARGLQPLAVQRSYKVDTNNIILSKKVSKNKIADFLELLGDTLTSGLMLTTGTEEYMKTEKKGYMSVVVKGIDEQLRRGVPLSGAMEEFPTVFAESDVYLIKSGENTGKVEEVLQQLGDSYRKSGDFTKAMIGSLIYPFVIVLMALLVTYVLVVYLVPTVSEMYDQLEGELPAITMMVVGASEQLTKNYILYLLIAIVGVIVVIVALKQNDIRYRVDKVVLKVPMVGNLIRTYETYQISYVLSSLLEGGVPTHKTLDIVTRVPKNRYIRKELLDVMGTVKADGVTLSEAFGRTTQVMPVFMQNIRSGETNGDMPVKLRKLSVRLEKNLQKSLLVIQKTVSPVLIAILAIFVGILMFAVMAPVYSIMDYM